MLEQLDVLESARNAQAGNAVRRRGAQVVFFEMQAAGGGRIDAADQVEHRGLARAVGADQREHFAAPHLEADAVHRQHAAELHGEVLGG